MTNDEMTVKAADRIGAKEIFGYGLGQAACNTCWGIVSAFLTFFYTDVFLIGAGLAGSIGMISRIWDAVNDPIVGNLADSTRTRLGAYRPWVLFSAPLLMIGNILLFWAHPEWPTLWKNIYALVTYCIMVLVYTMVSVPYGAMPGVMTRDTNERTKLTTARNFAGTFVYMIVSANFLNIASSLGNGDMANGFVKGAAIFSLVSLPMFALCVYLCKEKITRPRAAKKTHFYENFKMIRGNTPLTQSCLIMFIYGMALTVTGTVAVYYFMYVAGDSGLYTYWPYFTNIPMLIGNICAPYISKKLGSKGRTGFYSGVLTFIFMAMLFFVGNYSVSSGNWTVFFIAAIAFGFPNGVFTSMCYATLPDIAEYTVKKEKRAVDGGIFAVTGFTNKLGMAFGTFFLGIILEAVGYIAGAEQTSLVKTTLAVILFFGMGAVYLIGGLIFGKYKLDAKAMHELTADES